MKDLGARDLLAIAPLLSLTVAIGVAPFLLLDVIHRATEAVGL